MSTLDAFFKFIGVVIIAVLGAVAIAILTPLMYAVGGYFTGWVLKSVFPFAGDWIVSGAAVLGVEIVSAQLPTIGALLGFVGAFFKATQTNKVEK